MKYKIGDWVRKEKGYKFEGEVRAAFTKTTGEIRYVVEEVTSGMLHIFNEDQLIAFIGHRKICFNCLNKYYEVD